MRVATAQPDSTASTRAPKAKVFFRLPELMAHEFNSRIADDGYGERGKSRWVRESIESFLRQSHWSEFLLANLPDMGGQDERESAYLDRTFLREIDDAISIIKAENPQLERMRSTLIRCAITNRLLRF